MCRARRRARRGAREAGRARRLHACAGCEPAHDQRCHKARREFDLLRDFAPIGDTGESTFTLCASKELGVTTLAELIAKAKSKPGELKIGHVGVGSDPSFINELLKSAAGIDLSNVPYRGEAQASVDLVAGRIDLMFLVTAKQLSG